MTEGRALHCPQCGAPVSPDGRSCPFCSTVLALVACPSCFAQIFQGSKHCSFCGASTERAELRDAQPLPCPHCQKSLTPVAVGSVAVGECSGCGGLWVDAASFERICAEREQQAVVLGTAFPAAPPRAAAAGPPPERYWPCPGCQRLMNRLNFAHCSGVIVDVCKTHGVWFDPGELQRIVEFIRGGGLERAREREKMELEYERQRLKQQTPPHTHEPAPLFPDAALTAPKLQPLDFGDVVSAARDLLRTLFR